MNEVGIVDDFFDVNDPIRYYPKPSQNWKTLFDFYNQENVKKLNVSCIGCYKRVYDFCRKRLLEKGLIVEKLVRANA